MGRKEKWRMGEEEYKERRNGESIDLLGWHVTNLSMHICIIPIVNLQAE